MGRGEGGRVGRRPGGGETTEATFGRAWPIASSLVKGSTELLDPSGRCRRAEATSFWAGDP